MNMEVYLDSAASTQLHPDVLAEMLPYLGGVYGNSSSIHSFGRKNKAAVELARKSIAKAIGAESSSEIFFFSCASEANNFVLKSLIETQDVKRIVTSKVEHKSVYNTCLYLKKKYNIVLDYVELDSVGRTNLESLTNILKSSEQKTLVSLMHVQNELGSVNNISAISKICKEYDALFHCDAVQGIGHYDLDLKKIGVDFVTASAHKFHGPLGIGFLYKKSGVEIGTWVHGGGQEKNVRSGTENVAGIVGMAKALTHACENLGDDKLYVLKLKNQLKNGLKQWVPEIVFNEGNEQLYTILSASFPNSYVADTLMIKFDIAGIAVSGGSACGSGALTKTMVQETLNFPDSFSTVRFSFSPFNTPEEIDYVLDFFKGL